MQIVLNQIFLNDQYFLLIVKIGHELLFQPLPLLLR